jgi:hypothetical protein
MWECAVDDDMGNWSELSNGDFCFDALLFAWDQTQLIVTHNYSLSLLSDIDAKQTARQYRLAVC